MLQSCSMVSRRGHPSVQNPPVTTTVAYRATCFPGPRHAGQRGVLGSATGPLPRTWELHPPYLLVKVRHLSVRLGQILVTVERAAMHGAQIILRGHLADIHAVAIILAT